MTQVKIFKGNNLVTLEANINSFLKELPKTSQSEVRIIPVNTGINQAVLIASITYTIVAEDDEDDDVIKRGTDEEE